ncbi:MAG: methyltransferase type 11 [Desulfobulbus propionicus]|nr:MAG: methyltransferase type 11 [Desulfobulbus propionicus]
METQIRTIDIFEVATEENFDEQRYLRQNPDVQEALDNGEIKSGYAHFIKHGKEESRSQQKLTSTYEQPVRELRKAKAEKIKKILKPDIAIDILDNLVFDYTGEVRKKKFGFSTTEKVSSFFYDSTPLDIINMYPDGLILDCGSGFRPVYYENVVNYEIVPYPTTDVVGFAEDLPFADNSFDAVFSFAVLEHVKLPFDAAREMCRVLKPGGKMAVCAAFLQPVHGYPHHYFNMTRMGIQTLFEEDIDIEKQFINPGTGPIWTLSWFLRRWVDQLEGKDKKRFMKMKVADLIEHPLKYLDKGFVTSLSDEANFELASATLLVGQKKRN